VSKRPEIAQVSFGLHSFGAVLLIDMLNLMPQDGGQRVLAL